MKYVESVAGADANNLQQGTVNSQTVYEFGPGGVQTGRVLGYELNRQFEFSSKNVVQIGTVASGASRSSATVLRSMRCRRSTFSPTSMP